MAATEGSNLSDHRQPNESDVLKALDELDAPGSGFGSKRGKLLRCLVECKISGVKPDSVGVCKFSHWEPDPHNKLRARLKVSDLRTALRDFYSTRGRAARVKFDVPASDWNPNWTFTHQHESSDGPPERVVSGRPFESAAAPGSSALFVETLKRAGLQNAFRIKKQNDARLRRVTELIRAECTRRRPQFRLVASSGHSYLHSAGAVWEQAGLAQAVGRGASFDVILESPFSEFAECRALANGLTEHHWAKKVDIPGLRHLVAEHSAVSVRVTEIPVNCSLFFTTKSVFYDPYLWGRPNPALPNENNFWVLEFLKIAEHEYGCYDVLKQHFEFVRQHSLDIREFWHSKGSFDRRTRAFERRMERLVRAKQRPANSKGKR